MNIKSRKAGWFEVDSDSRPPVVAAASASCRVHRHAPVRRPEFAAHAQALISPYAGPAAEFASAWRFAKHAATGHFVTPGGTIPSPATHSGRSHYETAIPLPRQAQHLFFL